MQRRHLLRGLVLASGSLLLTGTPIRALSGDGAVEPAGLEREQWREILEPERFRILFREGTEPPFSSPLDELYEPGTYICAACYLPLFDSETKFDSGTGWPSFHAPIRHAHVGTRRDFRLLMPRTEYHCARCGGHQGHVFNDGPEPTGQRWCNNGLALRFVPEGNDLPELRGS